MLNAGCGPGGSFVSSDIDCGSVDFRQDGRLTYSFYISGDDSWCTPNQSGRGSNKFLTVSRTGGTAGVTFNPAPGTYEMLTDLDFGASGGAGHCNGNWNIREGSGAGPILCSGTIQVNNTF